MLRHRSPRLLMAVLVGLVAACTTGVAGTPGPGMGWATITPPGLAPAVMVSTRDGLLVAGSSVGADHRPLLAISADGGWRRLPVTPHSGYGSQATLVYLGSAGGDLMAMGTATGGAHLNPRWTAWVGTQSGTTAGLVEEPQGMETFGGENAGGISGVVGGARPLIVGTWSISSDAVGITVWQHQGQLWRRAAAPPALAGSAASQTTATAVQRGGSGVVIAGLVSTVGGGRVRQRAAVWESITGTSGWRRVDLDLSASNSAATDLACDADSCLVVGRVADHLAAWWVRGAAVNSVADLPSRVVDRFLANPRVARSGPAAVIAGTGRAEVLATSGSSGWTSVGAPAGEVRQVAEDGGRWYLLIRSPDGSAGVSARPR